MGAGTVDGMAVAGGEQPEKAGPALCTQPDQPAGPCDAGDPAAPGLALQAQGENPDFQNQSIKGQQPRRAGAIGQLHLKAFKPERA